MTGRGRLAGGPGRLAGGRARHLRDATWTGCAAKPGGGSRATSGRQPAAVDDGRLRDELPDRRVPEGPAGCPR